MAALVPLTACVATSAEKQIEQRPAASPSHIMLCPGKPSSRDVEEEELRHANADNLSDDFGTADHDSALRDRVLFFINAFRATVGPFHTCLQPKSVLILGVDTKTYLHAGFLSDNTDYSIDLTGQTIHRKIVQQSLARILAAIKVGFNAADSLDGYDIVIRSSVRQTGDFGPTTWSERNYQFLIPRAVARSYADRQLTIQQLLDQSTVLCDNRKVDIRLE